MLTFGKWQVGKEWASAFADLLGRVDDWPAWISATTGVLTLLVVVVTAGFALVGLQDARRTRHGQLITDLTRDWTDPAVIEAHGLHGRYAEKDIVALVDKIFGRGSKKATRQELSDWTKLALVANLIEALGVLASEDAITPEVIYKMWGGAILTAWPKWDKAVRKLRKYDEEPDTFHYFEEISLEIHRIANERRQAREKLEATTSAFRAPQAQAEAEPEKDVQQSSGVPPLSPDVPNGSASVTRQGLQVLAALIALSALFRWIRRT